MAWLSINYNSQALNMPVMIDALIPQGHGGYKTIYLLHGAGGDHESWIIKSRIADYVDNSNIAVIMPSGNNKCYINNIHGKNYLEYINEELIDICNKWFPLSKNKDDNYIAGMSMGGYGAFNCAMHFPEKYNAAFSYSGLLDIIERYDNPQGLDMYPVFGERDELIESGYDLFTQSTKVSGLFSKNVDNSTKFFIECGLQDSRMHMSEKLYNHMKSLDYDISFKTNEGGHDWKYWDGCIEHTINYIKEN